MQAQGSGAVPAQVITLYRLDHPGQLPTARGPARTDTNSRSAQERLAHARQSSFVAVDTATTDSTGIALFNLPSPVAEGTTELMAQFVDASNTTWTSTELSQVVWSAQETNNALLAPTLTAEATTVTTGSPDTVVATVLDSDNQPVVGANVTFTVAGSAYVSSSMANSSAQRKAGLTTPLIRDTGYVVATDASGTAIVTLFSDAAGSSTVTAAYTIGGVAYTSQALVITWADDAVADPPPGSNPSTADFTSLALSAMQEKARAGSPIKLTATPFDDVGNPVALHNVSVMFLMTSAGAVLGNAATDDSGSATLVLDSGMPGRFVATAVNSAGKPIVSEPVLVTWPRSFKLVGPSDQELPVEDDGSGLTDQQLWYGSGAEADAADDSSDDGSGWMGDQLGSQPGEGQDAPDDASSNSIQVPGTDEKSRVSFGWVK